MKVLLLSATQQEIQPFLQTPHQLDVLIGGVGIASTVYKLTKQLHHHYDLVIQAGIAGAFADGGKNMLEPATVVTVKQDCFGDLGAIENNAFSSVQQMGFSANPEWLVNQNPLLDKLPFKQVKAITVNTITDETGSLKRLQDKWQADIETMEGAGLHFVCSQQHTEYIQLRSISNVVGVRDKSQWHFKKAIASLNEALSNLVNGLPIKKVVHS